MFRCFLAKMNFEREFRSVSSELLNKGTTMVGCIGFLIHSFPYALNLTSVCFRCHVFFPAQTYLVLSSSASSQIFPRVVCVYQLVIPMLARVSMYMDESERIRSVIQIHNRLQI
jgi:hypothetical protein